FLGYQSSARSHSRRGGSQGDHQHSGCLCDFGRQRDGRHLPGCVAQSGRQSAHSLPRLPALLGGSGKARNRAEHLLPERRRRLAARSGRHQEKDHAADARDCADQSQQPDWFGLHAQDARANCRTGATTQPDHLCDEIYDKLIIDDDPHVAMAAVAPDVPVITFGGLSKNYLAPGWRIGWGIASGEASVIKPYIEGVNKLLRARLCANHPEQYAIPAALEGPQDHLIEVKRKLRSRRDLTMKWCSETPRVSCVAPRGAFYAYPRIDIPEGDDVFVTELIRQKYVTVVHGSGFGQR